MHTTNTVTPWKDRIAMDYRSPVTAEDRIRLVTYLTGATTVVVNWADLRDLLSTLDALRQANAERGDVIAGLMKGER